jgi:hypothetical protein
VQKLDRVHPVLHSTSLPPPSSAIVLSPHFALLLSSLSYVRFLSSFSSSLLPLSYFVFGLRLAFVRFEYSIFSFDSSWIGGITCDFRDGNLVFQRGLITYFFWIDAAERASLILCFGSPKIAFFDSSLFGSVLRRVCCSSFRLSA